MDDAQTSIVKLSLEGLPKIRNTRKDFVQWNRKQILNTSSQGDAVVTNTMTNFFN